MVVGGRVDDRAHRGADVAKTLSILGIGRSRFKRTTKNMNDHHTHLSILLDEQRSHPVSFVRVKENEHHTLYKLQPQDTAALGAS